MANRAATYAKLLQQQAPGLIVVAQIGIHERVVSWTATSGRSITYEATIEQRPSAHNVKTITAVKVAQQETLSTDATPVSNEPTVRAITPTSLTSRASVALVDANPGSFHFDPATSILYVSMSDSGSPLARYILAAFTLYVTTGDPFTAGAPFVDTDGNQYWPYLAGVPSTRKAVTDPFFGVVQQGTATLVLAGASGGLDAIFASYLWEQGSVSVLMGGDSLPFSEFTGPPQFRIFAKRWSDRELILELSDAAEDLRRPVPRDVFVAADASTSRTYYRGAGDVFSASITATPVSVESTAATTRIPIGFPKRVAYGRQVNIEPLPLALSSSSGGYAILHLTRHPNYQIESVTMGSETDTDGDGTTFDWYATEEKDQILIDCAAGYIPADQTFRVTFTGKKDTDGYPIDQFADIVEDLVEVEAGLPVGMDEADLDLSRFHGNLYTASLYLTEPTQLVDVIDAICRSTLAYFYVGDDDEYHYVIWYPNLANAQTLDEAWGDFLDIQATTDISRLYQAIFVEYAKDEGRIGGEYLTLQVMRAAAAGILIERPASFTIQASLLADETSAFVLGNRYARFCLDPAYVVTVRSKIRPMSYDLLTRADFTRDRLPMPTGLTLHGQVIELERDFNGFETRLVIDDQRVVGSQAFISSDGTLAFSAATTEQRRINGFWTSDDGFAVTGDGAAFGTSRYW